MCHLNTMNAVHNPTSLEPQRYCFMSDETKETVLLYFPKRSFLNHT